MLTIEIEPSMINLWSDKMLNLANSFKLYAISLAHNKPQPISFSQYYLKLRAISYRLVKNRYDPKQPS